MNKSKCVDLIIITDVEMGMLADRFESLNYKREHLNLEGSRNVI